MANVKVNFKGALEDLQEFRKQATSKTIFKELGILAKIILYNRVKSGYGVAKISNIATQQEGTQKQKLASLSSPYIEYKKKLKKRGFAFGEFAKPAGSTLSNLTLSGQMLGSIKVGTTINGFVLEISGTRNDGKTNDDIATWVQEKGRHFFALTDLEFKIIKKEYDKYLRTLASKFSRKG